MVKTKNLPTMNILLPTDFSENSRNAIKYALKLFEEVPCTFHLLHVDPTHKKNEMSVNGLIADKQESFQELREWLNNSKLNPEHRFISVVKADFLIEAIRKQILEKNIDLIVMGTKGLTNRKTTIIGNNTSEVMLKVKCPVMAISENTVFRKPKNVLFPTDYKIHYEEKMIEALQGFLFLSGASIKMLEIYNTEKEPTEEQLRNRKHFQDYFKSPLLPAQTFYSFKEKNFWRLFITNRNVNLIVMAAKNLDICQRLLHNPQKNQIPFISRLPLLMLH